MRDEQGLAHHAAIYIAAAAVNAIIPFLVLPWMARWLGPGGFGTVGTFMAMVNVAAVLVGLSVHGRLSVAYYRLGADSLPSHVGACLGVLALTALPVFVILLVGSPLLVRVTHVEPPWLWCVGLAACGQFVVMVSLAVWQVSRSPYRYAATQVGFSITWAVLSLALIGVADMGWAGRALGQAIAAMVAAAVCIAILTRRRLVDWNPRRWPIKAALAFGLPLLPHSLAAGLMAGFDRFALSGNVGAVAAGHYFAAFQIAAVLAVAAAAINQAWIPWLYRRLAQPTPEGRSQIVQATYVLYGLLLCAALSMMVFATPLVHLIVGAAFAEADELLVFLAPASALSGMYYFVTGYLFFAGRTGTLSWITVLCSAFQAALTLALVKVDGARGVAIAAAVSAFVYWAATALAANRIHPMPWLAFASRGPV